MRQILCLVKGSLACGLVLFGTALAEAQAPKVKVEVGPRPVRATTTGGRATMLIGSAVALQDNSSVGKIVDLVLSDDGRVDYLVVREEEKYVLVPWTAARIDFDRHSIRVDLAPTRFREIPTFTQETWPNYRDDKYQERIYKIYGVKRPVRERREERRIERREK